MQPRLMRLSRRITPLVGVLTLACILLLPAGQRVLGVDIWTPAAVELTRKIVARIGAQKAVVLTVRNISSLGDDDVFTIRRALRAELRRLGVRPAETGRAAAEVRVTLSENAQGYLWIAEVQSEKSREVTMMPVERPQPEGLRPNPDSLVIRKTRVFEQDGPILDLAFLKTEAETDARILVLDLDAVSIYTRDGAAWRRERSVPVVRSRPWPRDPRGRLIFRIEGSFDAFTPGVRCSGAVQPTLSLDCRESEDPWPLDGAESGGTSAYFTPGRNFFDGRLQQDGGGVNSVPPFFSAASLRQGGAVLWAFAGLDGRTQLLQKGPEPLAIIEGWGSSVVAIKSSCGSGWQLLSTRAGSLTEPDALQAYEISAARGDKAVAVSAPVEFSGPVTALWPTSDSSTAVAVCRDVKTGRYAAFSLSVSCDQ